MPKKGYKQTKEHKKKGGDSRRGKPSGMKGKHQSKEAKIKISKNNSRYWKGKHLSKKTKRKMSISHIGKSSGMREKYQSKEAKIKISKKQKEHLKNHPEILEKIINNGFGTKCYSNDGLFFSSIGERNCYYFLKNNLKSEVIHNFLGRFDFLINNKIVLEYHPCGWWLEKRSLKQYYKERRKLLDEYGYKDLKLIVVENLKQLNNLEI